MGAIGPRGSTRQAHFYLTSTEAKSIISLGMAFGISRRHQQLGTVLVSDSLFPYDVRTVETDVGGTNPWVYRYDAASSYPATTYPAKRELRDLLRRYRAETTLDYPVEFGCLLTGSARIRSSAYLTNLIGWCADVAPDVVGGEMEGLGLLSLAARDQSPWIVVKGICDFADEHQVGDARTNRQRACQNAARFVLDALRAWNPSSGEV